MVKKSKEHFKFSIFMLMLLCFFSFMPMSDFSKAPISADTESYSNVLDDLKIDENFNTDDYPVSENDYSLQVIQIAETTGKELLIYVYEPCIVKDFKATSINISTGINDNLSYKNYELNFLNSEGVFYKYVVKDFKIKDDALRYYDISSVFRKWDESIDEKLTGDNTIEEVSYNVEKLYTASTVEDKTTYTCIGSETIEIVNKKVGFLRYFGGLNFLGFLKCDSHYVAFSTERQIDKLMEADVEFQYRDFKFNDYLFGQSTTFGDYQQGFSSMKSEDVAEKITNGIFARQYSWNRIQSKNDFIEKEKLTDEAEKDLKNMQWVLRFKETSVKEQYGTVSNANYYLWGTVIEQVTILKLKFETQGIIYNIGVVDNKQSGDLKPDNKEEDWFKKLLISIAIILCLGIFVLMFFPKILVAVFKVVYNALVYVLKGLVWLISAPFSIFNGG